MTLYKNIFTLNIIYDTSFIILAFHSNSSAPRKKKKKKKYPNGYGKEV